MYESFFHCWCLSFFCFDVVVLYAEYFESLLDADFLFCEASCFAGEACYAFSEFAAESVDVCDLDLVFWCVSVDVSVYAAYGFAVFS